MSFWGFGLFRAPVTSSPSFKTHKTFILIYREFKNQKVPQHAPLKSKKKSSGCRVKFYYRANQCFKFLNFLILRVIFLS